MFELKPCPFCGGTKLEIDSREFFEKLQAENGEACMSIECKTPNCYAQMFDHTHEESDYDKRMERLVDKWNRRTEHEQK